MLEKAIQLDEAGAVGRLGDRELFLEIAVFFAERIPAILQEIRELITNTPDAEKVEGRSLEDLTRLVHSLKGNCAVVGAESVRATAYDMEQLCRAGELRRAKAVFAGLRGEVMALQEALFRLH